MLVDIFNISLNNIYNMREICIVYKRTIKIVMLSDILYCLTYPHNMRDIFIDSSDKSIIIREGYLYEIIRRRRKRKIRLLRGLSSI